MLKNPNPIANYDLITPDGRITALAMHPSGLSADATVIIEDIPQKFVGFSIPSSNVFFNIKSTVAQLGIEGISTSCELDKTHRRATVQLRLQAYGKVATEMLKLIREGSYIGKLFAADDRRRVRDPDYLSRMFGRADRWGKPLLSLGALHGSDDLILEKVDGRTIAYLSTQRGQVTYNPSVFGFLPTIAQALSAQIPMRDLLKLHQEWHPELPCYLDKNEILLVKTLPLHIRTVFGCVIDSLLPHGYHHTSANLLQPDTQDSGDIYEFYGDSNKELTDIPLEFYTLEPYREHVFFSDRDQLQASLEDSHSLFTAFETSPPPKEDRAAVFVVKGDQMLNLQPSDWIIKETRFHEFPGVAHGSRQALMVERYIEQQPCYAFLKQIDDGIITSQGVLLTRYFPSPLMKRMLLSNQVQRCLKRIYFQYPSQSHGSFFSAEDRALLHDLDKFAIPVYWVDEVTKKILQYTQKPERDTGLFVPLNHVDTFLKSTVFGIYGSNLLQGHFELELKQLLAGVLNMQPTMSHPLLNPKTPLALVTGGGPGAMEVGNRVAKELNILSCANIVDFHTESGAVINEQLQNPYIEAKMTYRLDKLVERQAEFNLDFPIFLPGGIGTDFEYCLEEVRRKIGSTAATPIILFGTPDYWRKKITPRFQCNIETGTIKGSEWLSNCFYCIQTAAQGLRIYQDYFTGVLPIGSNGPLYKDGFCIVP